MATPRMPSRAGTCFKGGVNLWSPIRNTSLYPSSATHDYEMDVLLHFLLAHGHAIDGVAEFGEGDGFVEAQLLTAVFAEQENGEVIGRDVEATAGGFCVGRSKGGVGGRRGFVRNGDDENVTLGESDSVVVKARELCAEAGVVRGGGEDEQRTENGRGGRRGWWGVFGSGRGSRWS